MTIPLIRKCTVLLACGTLGLIASCRPKNLDDIKTVKAEAETLTVEQEQLARELSGMTSHLDVLGRDSTKAEEAVKKLENQKLLMEQELARLNKLSESIAEQRESLKKEHSAYTKKFNSK
jgi:hypothetical protein